MRTRTVIDGNAFYEIDEECLEQKQRKEMQKKMSTKEVRRKEIGREAAGEDKKRWP